MNRAAKLIALSVRDIEPFARAASHVRAVFSAAGSAVIACRDDAVVFDDNCAEISPQASPAFSDSLRDIEVIVYFVNAIFHNVKSSLKMRRIIFSA